MKPEKDLLDLDSALEQVAKKVKPSASVYTISPSNCETQACGPQCDCCSQDATTYTQLDCMH